jgi:hypothetical protein
MSGKPDYHASHQQNTISSQQQQQQLVHAAAGAASFSALVQQLGPQPAANAQASPH